MAIEQGQRSLFFRAIARAFDISPTYQETERRKLGQGGLVSQLSLPSWVERMPRNNSCLRSLRLLCDSRLSSCLVAFTFPPRSPGLSLFISPPVRHACQTHPLVHGQRSNRASHRAAHVQLRAAGGQYVARVLLCVAVDDVVVPSLPLPRFFMMLLLLAVGVVVIVILGVAEFVLCLFAQQSVPCHDGSCRPLELIPIYVVRAAPILKHFTQSYRISLLIPTGAQEGHQAAKAYEESIQQEEDGGQVGQHQRRPHEGSHHNAVGN